MIAERLREAAKVLRDRAELVGRSPWDVLHLDPRVVGGEYDQWAVMGCFYGDRRNPSGPFAVCDWEPSATYIAAMHPGVGLALADWLDWTGRALVGTSKGDVPFEDIALRIADLILGGTQ